MKKINEDIATIVKLPDVQAHWQTIGALTVVGTPSSSTPSSARTRSVTANC